MEHDQAKQQAALQSLRRRPVLGRVLEAPSGDNVSNAFVSAGLTVCLPDGLPVT